MKNRGLILVIILALGLGIFFLDMAREGNKKEKVIVAEGRPAPVFEVAATSDGAMLSSSQLRGRVVFLNFWASWCDPCKNEMPSIQAVYDKTRTDDRFVMITVLYEDKSSDALSYMQRMGYNFPVYVDQKKMYRSFGVTGVPETYVIDKKGILRKKVIGPLEWNEPAEMDFISSLLNE